MYRNEQSDSPRVQLSLDPGASEADPSSSLHQLLALAIASNASDIILVNGSPVTFRVNGALTAVPGPDITAEDTWSLLEPLLSTNQYEELKERRCLDFCFVRGATARFRANLHFLESMFI